MNGRRTRPTARRGKELTRQTDLIALKARYGFTWQQISDITGYNWSVLKQMSCGAKVVSKRALEFISLKLAEHARSGKPQASEKQPAPV